MWLAPRALILRAGRPCLPHAHQTAREWSVFHHGWTGANS